MLTSQVKNKFFFEGFSPNNLLALLHVSRTTTELRRTLRLTSFFY